MAATAATSDSDKTRGERERREKKVEIVQWVQCDNCLTWRELPPDYLSPQTRRSREIPIGVTRRAGRDRGRGGRLDDEDDAVEPARTLPELWECRLAPLYTQCEPRKRFQRRHVAQREDAFLPPQEILVRIFRLLSFPDRLEVGETDKRTQC